MASAPRLRETVESYNRQGAAFQATVETDWRRGLDEHCLMPMLDGLQLTGCTLLDVGAGTGRWTRAALQRGAADVYALEPSEKMADVARELEKKERHAAATSDHGCGEASSSRGRVHYLLGDAVGYDLSSLAADVAIASHVLHYLGSPDQLLRALRNVYGALRVGGRLLGANICVDAAAPALLRTLRPPGELSMPNGNCEWRVARAIVRDPPFETTFYVQRWETLRQLLEEAGFRRVERVATSIDNALLSAMSAEEANALLALLSSVAFFSAEK